MNHIYRLVWNRTLCALKVAPETAGSQGSGGTGTATIAPTASRRRTGWSVGLPALSALSAGLLPAIAMAATPIAGTLPTGPVWISGSGTVNSIGTTTTVNQYSSSGTINWSSFDVATYSTVNFTTGSNAVTLNNISGTTASQIYGSVSAAGQTILANANGLVFGGTTSTGGLLATSLGVSAPATTGGSYSLDAAATRGTVAFAGGATFNGNSAALVGAGVSNNGLLMANGGRISLVAADHATMTFDDSGLMNVAISGALSTTQGSTAVVNTGTLLATGGTIVMAAAAQPGLYGTLVNNSGVINANGGNVRLSGTGGAVVNNGSIDVSQGGQSQAGQVQITSDAAVSLGGNIDASGTTTGGSIAISGGSVQLGGTLTAGTGQISLQSLGDVLQTWGSLTAGTLTGSAIGSMKLDQSSNSIAALGPISTGSDFALTTTRSLGQSGPLSIGGDTTINAGTNAITLTNASNAFGGAVNLTGGATQITSGAGLNLGTVNTGTLTATSTGALVFGTTAVNGSLSATSNRGFIMQNGALTIAGNSTFNAGTGAIALTNMGNWFGGTVNLTGGATTISSASALTFGNVNTDTLLATSLGPMNLGTGTVRGNLSASTIDKAITQSGALSVAGSTTISAGTGAITLTDAGNSFQGPIAISGGSVQIGGTLAAGTGQISLQSSGDVRQTGGSLTAGTLTGSAIGNMTLNQSSNSIAALGPISTGGDFALTTTRSLGQSGALSVGGDTTINAGTNAISLTNASNSFAGAVNLTGGTTIISSASALTFGNVNTDTLLATSLGPMNLGTGTVRGNLSASTIDKAITQSGALSVAGSTTISAGTGAITLTDAGNSFQGPIAATGSSVALRAAGDLRVSALNNSTNGAVSLTAGGALTLPVSAINTGTSNLQLAANGGTLLANAALSGSNVTISARDGIALYGPVTASGQLALSTSAGQWIFALGDVRAATTQLSSGTLRIGNATTTGSIGGNVVNNGTLMFNRTDSIGYADVITGTGNLVQQGTGTLTLTGVNTYTGATQVAGGTLALSGAGSIANSSGVQVDAAGILDISGITAAQASFGSLSGAGQIKLGTRTLATGGDNSSGTLSGAISGTGGLLKTGSGTLTLGGDNSFSGGTSLKQGRIDLGSNGALGTGTLSMDDGTTLGIATDGLRIANAIRLTGSNDPVIDTGAFNATLAGAISGSGFLTKNGSGALTLAGANDYTGATNVAAGTLRAGAANTFSAASVHTVASGATLDLAGFSQRVAGLNNGGVVSLMGTTPGATLTVTGPYTGNNGSLRMGTALGDSTGVSDRLILSGPAAIASGQTTLQITNLNGLGALTAGNGIEVISAVNGASTTAQTSKNAFVLAGGHVDAGAYQYRLYAADAKGSGENWYLRSNGETGETGEPTETTPTTEPADPPVTTYRAEAALYAALPSQLRQSNLAMIGNLHQRVGDDDPRSATSGTLSGTPSGTPAGRDRRAWARVLTTDVDVSQDGTVSPKSKGRLTGFQAGTDLLATQDWRAGLYVGQLDGNVSVNGFVGGIANAGAGRNDLHNQYLGFYGTYAGNSGFYADAVLQLGRHRYTVTPASSSGVETKGDSLLASLELGRAFPLGGSAWSIEPQLQVVHQRIHLDNAQIPGAMVQNDVNSSWLARVGARVKGEMEAGSAALRPYGRVNLYMASNGSDVARFTNPAATTDIVAATGGTSIEVAAGLTAALNRRFSLYGEVGRIWAAGGNAKVRNSILGSAGLQVKW
ncbi:autotransporter outer membrane beta-barrel domain-containing protein [Cupriavidus metallidurans]|uniref:autotransporter outer membrane beta-barrel domain-containing protein n=1 Tax=Cupriavidus metallidurans TaxID=119219 RepID=UPI0039AFC9CE